jgi:O-antigen ligase
MNQNMVRGLCAFLIASMFLLPVSFGASAYGYPQLLALLVAILIIAIQNYLPNDSTVIQIRLIWLLPVLLYCTLQASVVSASTVVFLSLFVMLLIGLLVSAGRITNYPDILALGILIAALGNLVIGIVQFTNNHAFFYPVVAHPTFKDIHYVYGNVRQANLFSTLMCLGIASIWYLAGKGIKYNRVAILAIIALVVGVVLSASRTGLLILLLFSALHLLWRPIQTNRQLTLFRSVYLTLSIIYAAVWLLASYIGPVFGLYLREGLTKGRNVENPSRLDLYQNVIEMIQQSPWFGYGVGQSGYTHFIHDFGNHRHKEIIENAHNIILHAGLEIGIVGALLLVVPFTVCALKQKPWRVVAADKQMAWMIIAALVTHSLLEYPLHYGSFWLIFCMACCVVFSGLTVNLSATKMRVILLTSSVCLTIFWAYAAWDYDRVSQPFAGPHQRYADNDPTPFIQAQKSVIFKEYARFSILAVVDVTPQNAEQLIPELKRALRYSSEGRVSLRLIEALILTGRLDQAKYYAYRFQAAYPQDFKQYLAVAESVFKDVLIQIK